MMERSEPDFQLMGFGYAYAIFILLLGIMLLNKLGSKAAEKL
jgi:hypothetical protein